MHNFGSDPVYIPDSVALGMEGASYDLELLEVVLLVDYPFKSGL